MTADQAFEKALSRCAVPARLQKYLDRPTILVNCSPSVVLLPWIFINTSSRNKESP